MGSDETAITVPGGPRVIDVFYANEAPSGPNYLLFSDVDRLSDSLWDRSEVGWSPRPHAAALGALQSALDRNLWQIMVQRAIERKGPCLYVCTDGSRRACGVGACARLVATLGAPRETSGPRFDRISLARPPCGLVRLRTAKLFLAPSTCPIDLFYLTLPLRTPRHEVLLLEGNERVALADRHPLLLQRASSFRVQLFPRWRPP